MFPLTQAKAPQHFTNTIRVSKKTFRKGVSLVALTGADATKPGTSKAPRLNYSIVTQVYLCLSPEQCNVASISDLVAEQPGFPVILSANAGTCGVDFGKSSRKL